MNRQEYEAYESAVADFFESEGLQNLSIITTDSDEDCETSESYFSWQPCECCCRSLAGDRYDCNGYNPDTEEVQGPYSVCVDCVYYAEYGQLDDMTMLDIEDSDA